MNWRTSSGATAVKPLRLCLVIIINYVISSSCDEMKVVSVDADDDAVDNPPSNPAAALSQESNLFVDTILCRRPYSKFCITGEEDVSRQNSRGAQRQQLLPISPAAEDGDEVFELLDPEAWQARQLSAFQQTKFNDGVAGRRRAGNGAEANRKRVGAPPKGFVLSRGRRRRTAVNGL